MNCTENITALFLKVSTFKNLILEIKNIFEYFKNF